MRELLPNFDTILSLVKKCTIVSCSQWVESILIKCFDILKRNISHGELCVLASELQNCQTTTDSDVTYKNSEQTKLDC